jgi:hypothetical protein
MLLLPVLTSPTQKDGTTTVSTPVKDLEISAVESERARAGIAKKKSKPELAGLARMRE